MAGAPRPAAARQAGIAASRSPYRLFGGFRLLLACMVMLQHFQYLLPETERPLFSHFGFGVTAVAVFFVISGFIVAEANETFYAARPGAFLCNRLLRVVPPYLAALALSVLLHEALWRAGLLRLWDFAPETSPVTPEQVLAGVVSLLPGARAGALIGGFEFVPFVWSLRVELAFYLLAAVAFQAVDILSRRAGPAVARAAGVGLLLACFAVFAIWRVRGGPLLIGDLPCFLFGVTVYRFWRQPGPGAALAALVALACTLLGFAAWQQRGQPVLADQVPVLLGLFALFGLLTTLRAAPRWQGIDKALGALSYPLYLNHYVVGIGLYDLTAQRGFGLYALGAALSLLLAAVMHWGLEVPLAPLRTRIRGTPL
ncbi:MAG TPA: acyltransferase family protein [Acetobacteraceae bacterium]|nr:acyltransferase family protein [Acetobacteraceae bacterium]